MAANVKIQNIKLHTIGLPLISVSRFILPELLRVDRFPFCVGLLSEKPLSIKSFVAMVSSCNSTVRILHEPLFSFHRRPVHFTLVPISVAAVAVAAATAAAVGAVGAAGA